MSRHAEVVDRLVATDPAQLPDEVLKRRILGVQAQLRRLQATLARDVRELELRGSHVEDAAGTVVSWLQAQSNTSRQDAAGLRRLGRDCERLPVMAAALAAGEVSVAHVQVLAAATRRLDAERVAADEKHLVDLAREFDPTLFGICVRRWVAVTFPDRHERDTQRDYDSRWLRLAETIGGMVALSDHSPRHLVSRR